jgi:hypothetical protein
MARHPSLSPHSVGDAVARLLAYCEAHGWAGHDPYDALNSRLFAAFPWLDSTASRLVLIQTLKRSPVNIRPLLFIPRTQNPKGLALCLAAVLKLPPRQVAGRQALVRRLIDRLGELRSKDAAYSCWGYSFPWQTRDTLIARGAANLVCTTFVADALLDAYAETGDPQCLEMAVSSADYIANELFSQDGSRALFRYPTPSTRTPIHNANFLGAALLSRVYALTGEARLRRMALAVARYSASRQEEDGSWRYGEGAKQGWIDNFHTGYNLSALDVIARELRTTEFDTVIQRGFAFYRSHFFRPDGAVRYYHDRTYPIDIHCVAQSIITLVNLRHLDRTALTTAQSVCDWAFQHMWDDRGFFYYRILRAVTIRTSFMRWSQAWMLLAMATLVDASERATNSTALATPAAAALGA